MSLLEYSLRMEAFQLQQVDKHNELHLQAWLNNAAGATKEQGKKHVPVFKSYKDFFDYEKELKEVTKVRNPTKIKIDQKTRRLARLASAVNSN